MQYGVYIGGEKSVNFSDINLYFNGTKITNKRDLTSWSSGHQWTCNGYVVAIYNSSKSAYVSLLSGYEGNMPNKNVNIPPQTIVFFNIDYCRNAFASGSGSGSGSGSSSGSDFLTNCYLSFKIKSISSDDTKVTLDFTGVNNYQAT